MSELKAKKVLEYWYSMEYFAPFFPNKKKEDIVLYGTVQQDLPWNFARENEVFYTYIGKINVDDLIAKLHNTMNIQESIGIENSVTFVGKIKLNNKGEYVKGSFSISTFLFAITSIIKAKGFGMQMNEAVIDDFNSKIDSVLQSNYSKVNHKDNLIEIEDLILRELDYLNQDNFYCVLRQQTENENKDEAEEDMLHSFYLKDLSMVLNNLKNDDKIINYIASKDLKDKLKIKIDRDVEEMRKWTFPDKYPMGKWPSKHSPNLMQQIAINIAISDESEAQDIFSVNSPQGIGKKTLIKEVIANNIVNRAAEISKYDDPDSAFKMCNVKNPPDDCYKTYYEFPKEMEKYSIVVASNNTSAVENISLDLPNAFDVEESKTHTGNFDVDRLEEVYFSDVATKLTGKKSWGLISAHLGKQSNISQVKKALNTNENQLFGSYFNDEFKKVDWNIAKEGFIKQYNLVKRYQAGIISDAKRLYELYDKKAELDSLELEQKKLCEVIEEKQQTLEDLVNTEKRNLDETETVDESILNIKKSLGFFKRLIIKLSKKSIVRQNLDELNKIKEKLLSEYTDIQTLKVNTEKEILQAQDEFKASEERHAISFEVYIKAYKEIELIKDKYKTSIGDNFADNEFFENITNNNISQNLCPWTNEKYDELREELFFRALVLQKAFVQNANGVKQNISMLYKVWDDNGFYESDKREFFKDVFNTLFLVIPVVSTNFASVERLFKYIGKEEIGTLIVDEAGEATPSSAIGALWRTKKAIVVGGSLQVEPVGLFSKDLSRTFINNLGIDPDYGRKELSVQEFADLVNPFSGEINGVSVGCPLGNIQ